MDWRDRAHFFALCARIMRGILVDHARARRYAKRGAGKPLRRQIPLIPAFSEDFAPKTSCARRVAAYR